MALLRNLIACITTFFLLVALPVPAFAQQAAEAARAAVIAGVTSFGGGMLVSRVACDNPRFAPLAWASPRAQGGDSLGLQGTLPVPAWLGSYGRGRVVVWGAHEGFFGGGPDGALDNDALRQNMLSWLLADGKQLGFTNTHGEWLTAAGFSPTLKTWLDSRQVGYRDVDAALTTPVLANLDCLVVGNPWQAFTAAEQKALLTWVRHGGGLLLLGLGWSWYGNHEGAPGEVYPVNELAAHFGCRILDGSITDPAASNADADQPMFHLNPLADYKPAHVEILCADETDADRVKTLAQERQGDIFIVEGQYMGLQLPTEDWLQLDSPASMSAILDQAYLAELELVGGANRAYHGAMIWYVAADDPQGEYWFHSGNPIVFKQEASQEIVSSFNAGWPGWGMLHEQGHNMVITACNDLFVHEGTAEPWCNVFTVWAIHRMGWPERDGSYDAGHAYHATAQPDFTRLTSDPWILLGCLELIWSKYGWDGMQRFMTQAASDAAAGRRNQGDAAATAYFVEQLSQAYGVDFAPLIAHWGFPVSDASRTFTSRFPASEITWPTE